MAKIFLFCLLSTVLLLTDSPAEAQQAKQVYRIGYLSALSRSAESSRLDGFRQALRELGYVEGKNIIIETRYAEGKLDRLPALANELVRLKVDVIVTSGPLPTRVTKEATTMIPIVMAQDADLWLRNLQRRSQRGRRLTWAKFSKLCKRWLATPKILHPYPSLRFACQHPR